MTNSTVKGVASRWCSLYRTLAVLLLCSSSAFAQNNSIFGPNVYVFTPAMSSTTIQNTLNTLNNEAQFSTNRFAVLFQPGTYSVQAEVGYYESIAGLGASPTGVTINGYLTSNQTDSGGNITQNFWRSLENVTVNSPTTLQWGVSQGTAFRRMNVNGPLQLTNTNCGFASGGFISDTVVTGNVNPCSQQQWYSRNSSFGSWTGGVWNMVFSGVSGAPAPSFPNPPETVLPTTPVSREKPFLYVDSSGNYNVFVPTLQTNSSATTWANGTAPGYSQAISTFFIATPTSTLSQINSALAAGQNLLLTPGIYKYSGSINVTNPKTIVLGLGYANLVPQTGTAAITVADVDGVQVAGLMIDAGPVNSPVLFEVGNPSGPGPSHQTDPTSLNDVFFRIGGATLGVATTSLEVDSNNVILDNIWAWRADHGNGVGWTANVAEHGLIVNGNNVTALGLAVEHYEQNQVVWNGNGGETIFYQSELPYDVPSQSAWMNGSVDGYSSYSVSPQVTTHKAYGVGVYSFFNQGVNIVETSGITVPVATGVTVTDAVSVFLNGSGSITSTINSTGTVVQAGATLSDVAFFGGTSGGCSAVPSAPTGLTATASSSTAIGLSWTAVTPPANCTISSYSVYGSTTSGFTPSASNLLASPVTGTTFSNTGLTASTTHFYVVLANDAAGASVPSSQASATTSGSASCTAVPSAPAGLTATASSSTAIALSWTPVTPPANCTISSYSVYGSTTSGFTPSSSNLIAGSVTGTTFSNTGLTASTTHFYVVIANDAAGASVPSSQASATTSGNATCSAVPSAPAGLTATPSSSSAIALSWAAVTPPANCTISSYSVYGSTTSGFTPSSSNLIASSLTGTTFSNTGLTASTTHFYVVIANDAAGASVPSSQASATTQSTVTTAAIVAINAGGPAVSNSGGGDASYVADADFSGGGAAATPNTITTAGVTNAAPMAVYQTERAGVFTYTIPGLSAGVSYPVRLHFAEFYWTTAGQRVFNVSINGVAVLSNFDIIAMAGAANKAVVEQFNATANASGQIAIAFTSGSADQPKISGIEILQTASAPPTLQINSGGPTAGSYVADEDFNGGAAFSTTATINTSLVANPAPQAVYQSERFGAFTYTVPNLTAGANYTVKLHFAEVYFTAAGKRQFNVLIDGTQVLTNFDIFAAAGGQNIAIVESFQATASSTGTVTIQFTPGAFNNPKVSGIEIIPSGTVTPPPPPAAPTGLTATASSSSQISLSWTASPTAGVTYLIFRGSTAGFTPATGNQIGTSTSTTFADSGLAASTTYYYKVEATNSAGTSTAAGPANATTLAASGSTTVVALNAGGAAASPFVADADFNGGTASAFAGPVSTAGIATPPPAAIFLTQRFGNFSYTIPSLTPGNTYGVLLYFAESYWTAKGQRVFNVTINGTPVLTNFDVFATAGGQNIGIVEQFNGVANTAGQIVVAFTTVTDNAEVNGIAITTSGGVSPGPPAPPTGLSATAVSASEINLNWTASTTAGAQYEIFQSTTSGFTPSSANLLATVSGTTFSSTGLAASTTYYYLVEATNSAGTSTAVGPVKATTLATGPGTTAPPSQLTGAASSARQTNLNWVASTTPGVSYLIFRSNTTPFTPSSANQIGTTVGITNFMDSNYAQALGAGVAPSTTYFYMVEATNTASGTSPAIGPVSVTTLSATASAGPTTAPTGLTATTGSANEIDLLWNSSLVQGVSYAIFRSTTTPFTPSASNRIGTTKSNMFQDVVASAATQYYYQVEVTGPGSTGPSAPSATVTATTPALAANTAPFWDASGLPAKQNVVLLKFLNRTNGQYTDDQVFWSITLNGVTTTKTIAQQPFFDMPANSAGRMYFYLGHVGQTPTDYYDFIEFTVGPTSIDVDTTRVDAFAIKLAFRLTCSDGTDVAIGENGQTFAEPRATTFQRYLAGVPAPFQSEATTNAPYRIIEPGAGGFNAGGPNQNYYANYIAAVWAFNGITIPLAGPNGSGLTSNPDLSAAIYRHAAPTSGTPVFNAAGNLTDQTLWGNPANFYQADPYDHYAQWIKANAINMQQYAFPYDDAGGYSSNVACTNPQTMLVTIGW